VQHEVKIPIIRAARFKHLSLGSTHGPFTSKSPRYLDRGRHATPFTVGDNELQAPKARGRGFAVGLLACTNASNTRICPPVRITTGVSPEAMPQQSNAPLSLIGRLRATGSRVKAGLLEGLLSRALSRDAACILPSPGWYGSG
jgi:hypothetical protein